MKTSKYSDSLIMSILKQAEAVLPYYVDFRKTKV